MKSIVIGVSKGLGFCLTRLLLENGHEVAAGIVERQTPPALQALESAYPGKLFVFPCDVTNDVEVEAGAKLCAERFGQADTLVCVAGVLLPGDRVNTIDQVDVGELRLSFEVNTFGPIFVCKFFTPVMAQGAKVFVVVSEGYALKAVGTWIPCYGLSKTAATKVAGLFNQAVRGIDFYSVHPGRMNTDLGRTTAQIEPEESALGFYNMITGKTPLSRSEWYVNYKGEPMQG